MKKPSPVCGACNGKGWVCGTCAERDEDCRCPYRGGKKPAVKKCKICDGSGKSILSPSTRKGRT